MLGRSPRLGTPSLLCRSSLTSPSLLSSALLFVYSDYPLGGPRSSICYDLLAPTVSVSCRLWLDSMKLRTENEGLNVANLGYDIRKHLPK